MRNIIAVAILCLVIIESNVSNAATSEMTIGEATTFCERAVPQHCISQTCPQYCNALRSTRSKASCKNECTVEKRCKLKPAVGSDDAKNMALDAQNRDQLWACIAEKRDPNANKTGRRTTPWKELQTPSFTKAIRP